MFAFSSSRLSLNKIVSPFVSNAQLGILPFHSLFVIRSFSSGLSFNLNDHTVTVSFLMNSCGLTLKSAQSVSKKICFNTLERPDSVLRLLREHGFTNSHISKIVKIRPNVLLRHPERTILPKLEFLCSIGVSRSDLSVIVSRNPELLNRSIKQNLIPQYHILKSILASDEKVIKCLKRSLKSSIVQSQNDFFANLSLLRDLGIPQSSISLLFTCNPFIVCLKAFNFAEGVKKVIKTGFDPSAFVRALQVLLGMTQKTWEHKIEVFRRWGLSEDEISSIFRKNPSKPLFNNCKSTSKSFSQPLLRFHNQIQSISQNSQVQYPSGLAENEVKKVIKIGFDPSKPAFVRALQVLLGMTQKTWEHKIEVFRRWSLSEEEISSIFRKNPLFMALSEKNIMCSMNFLVGKMGWQPAAVAIVPVVLCYGLETWIMPRCSVIRVLLLKGLIKADVPVSTALNSRKKHFLKRFVIKYQDQVPQSLDIFQGKMGLTELGFGFDDKYVILD
ncbi:hypothetical protein P3X46_034274 [Hevea brasiliensis]|uniref:Uncharacterized protein n=1 Tax=Hevea brasiliensis TaxID=3981 RepID=A0ABQ9KA03_HEVBR|nr:hypothetical protein P3X46_034274 [Hevea brasiliensis]